MSVLFKSTFVVIQDQNCANSKITINIKPIKNTFGKIANALIMLREETGYINHDLE